LTVEIQPNFVNIVPAFVRNRIAHRPNLVKILDNMGWLFADKMMRMGAGVLLGAWIARYLGPEQFGAFSFASAFAGMFFTVAGLGLQSIVVRDIVRNPSCKEETLGAAAVLQFVGGGVAYGCMIGAIFWLRPEDARAKLLVAILGSLVLFKFSDIALYWFESQVLSKYIVWVQNTCFFLFAIIKIGLIQFDAHLSTFAWITAAEALLVSVLMFFMLGLRGPKLGQLNFSLMRAKILLSDSWPLLLSGVAVTLNMKVDQIMLGQMIGDEAVGIYSVAVRISEVWYFVIAIIMTSVFPNLGWLHVNKSELLDRRLAQAYGLMFWISIAAALMASYSASFLIHIIFGDKYVAAASVLILYSWAGVAVALGSVWSTWLLLENRVIIGLAAQLIAASLNIGLNIIFIPIYGIKGAAIVTVLSYSISGVLSYFLYKPEKTFGYIWSGIFFTWRR
jgi:PST family polysaccharide transporter